MFLSFNGDGYGDGGDGGDDVCDADVFLCYGTVKKEQQRVLIVREVPGFLHGGGHCGGGDGGYYGPCGKNYVCDQRRIYNLCAHGKKRAPSRGNVNLLRDDDNYGEQSE